MNKQIVVPPEVHTMLGEIVAARLRKNPHTPVNKKSVVSEWVLAAYKREVSSDKA